MDRFKNYPEDNTDRDRAKYMQEIEGPKSIADEAKLDRQRGSNFTATRGYADTEAFEKDAGGY